MTAREKAHTHVSAFDLDRLEMGVLDEERRSTIEAHLKTCAECREERALLGNSRAEFSSQVLPRTAVVLRARLRQQRRWFARPLVWAPALACAAAMMLVWARPRGLAPTDDQAIHTKGQSELLLVARQKGRVFTVDRFNHELHRGDEIRFVVGQGDAALSFLLIASIDGRGQTNVYFPYHGQKSGRIDHPGRWEVPGSIVLDEATGPERFFALFSREPVDAAALTAKLAALGRQGWDAIRRTTQLDWAGVEQRSMFIEKTDAQ